MTYQNPFFHRGAIRRAREFHGREADIRQILDLLRNGQSVSMVGPRRIGKSSLLLHLAREATRKPFQLESPAYLFALIDCQELGDSPPEDVYEALLVAIADQASRFPDLDFGDNFGTYRAMDQALSKLNRLNCSVVILLDEFELMAANQHLTPHFFARLRGLTTKYGVAYLTASQRPLFALTADEQILSSPFFNIFVSISLGLFSDEEAANLIDSRVAGSGITFDEKLAGHILNLVGPHPFYLHIAGYHAFQILVNSNLTKEEPDLNALDGPVELEAESHLGYLWQNLTEDERYGLATLDGPEEVMRQLEQLCLIRRAGDKYEYTGDILRKYVRRQDVDGLIQVGPFVIDRLKRKVQADGRDLPVTSSQYELMTKLGLNAYQVVTGEDLEEAVWGDALLNDPDRLKTLIKRLRRSLEPYNHWVVSERGVGYSLRAPE